VIEYRAYIVGDDGHFLGYEPLICADDSEAITKARCLVRDHDVELWNGTRLGAPQSHFPRLALPIKPKEASN
jgi:hypothetical protein